MKRGALNNWMPCLCIYGTVLHCRPHCTLKQGKQTHLHQYTRARDICRVQQTEEPQLKDVSWLSFMEGN